MCEPTTPLDKLRDIKFSLYSLPSLHEKHTCSRQLCICAARGIEAEIDWVIRQLEAAGEGRSNCGA